MAELVWSVVEGQQLAEVFSSIQDYDPKAVKTLLKKALDGPVHPIDESATSNEARNTIFELMLGAQFRRAGASVVLDQRSDLVIDYFGRSPVR